MLYLILAALAAVIALWVFVPQFRVILDGLKTRILAFLTMAAGGITVVDPTLLSTALALDARGQAWLLVGLGALTWLFRELTKKPGKLVKRK